MKKLCSVTMIGIAGLLGANAAAEVWSDTSIGISYGPGYREPGVSGDIAKTVVNMTHAGGYKYGGNYFNVDFLKSNSVDPSVGTGNTDGSIEVYAVYRHQLSMSAVAGDRVAFGPVRDLSLTAGFDLGTKNNGFGSRPVKAVVGPTLNFAVDKGFFDLGLFWYRETNNNGIVGRKVTFDSTYQVSAAWKKNFALGLPAAFEGYLSYTGAKGKNGFGVETAGGTVAHALLMFDIGSLGGKPGVVYSGFGVDHYRNKYGERGVDQTTAIAQLAIHF